MALTDFFEEIIDKFGNNSQKPNSEKAIFIGRNGSCGLKNGSTYTVSLIHEGSKFRINVYDKGIGIPYDTMSGIQKNWDFRKR